LNNHAQQWESAFSGQETCPTTAETGIREIHNSGDVAFAVWQYYRATKDMNWLKQIGWPLLSGIADFWVSRSTRDAQGRANINDVIPPDEYHDHVNNSVFTNVIHCHSTPASHYI
jgi:trehalose/maltose hydrolase-like predicted phosphorylase